MFNKQSVALAVTLVLGGAISLPAAAQVSITGNVQARLGTMSRSGDTPAGFDNRTNGVDGLYALFVTATKDLKGGYNAGFNCVTVATTADGANAAFDGPALPVHHAWDAYFAGQDNYAGTNGNGYKQSGFASYGHVQGDQGGVMCNDEVNGFLETPYGRFTVGHIMNPMRLLYDQFTVNPVWANQRGYYQMSDLRGNALRYSNSWGPVTLDAQINTATSYSTPDPDNKSDYALSIVGTYEPISGTVIGLGVLDGHGGADNKFVTPGEHARRQVWSFAAKTRLGPVNVGVTYSDGKFNPTEDFASQYGRDFTKNREATVKVAYDMGKWSFQGFVSREGIAWQTGQWGGTYTVETPYQNGATFGALKVKRTNVDLWALYDMGKDVKTYLRANTVQKQWVALDTIDYSATVRATKLEGGWLINF